MAGIYIHTPYCHSKCLYCNFYSQTDISSLDSFVDSLCVEIEKSSNFIENEEISTIYFGGGTPSIFKPNHIEKVFRALKQKFVFSENLESTIEVNPDDVTKDLLIFWRKFFNRISIGIQSFSDAELKWLNRRHSAEQAIFAVKMSKEFGFENQSLDLIFGIPGMSLEEWRKNMEIAISLDVSHISAYALTVEPKTKLDKLIKSGKCFVADEELVLKQFDSLITFLNKNGFEHYEISNFAKKGKRSRHNSSYWSGENYFGFGPAAHSFNGNIRRYNFSDTKKYISSISNDTACYEEELLSVNDKYNEYILTKMRTIEGVLETDILKKFGVTFLSHFKKEISPFLENGVNRKGDCYSLTQKGKHIADAITASLFFV